MQYQGRVLSEDERQQIHQESLKILAETGVRFDSAKVRGMLKENGADVDEATRIVRIPEAMVTKALASAPKSFVLGGYKPENDFQLPAQETGYTLDGTGTYTQDFVTGERRYARLQDITDSARVFNRMDKGTIFWPPIGASDAPVLARPLAEFFQALNASEKHIQHELHRPSEVPYLIEALTMILGSEAAVRERKIVSVCYCPVAPLVHEEEMSEACIELGRYEVPVLIYPMPAAGSTGPASLFSNLSLANAEGLSGVVLYQMANPGCPLIFGDASGAIDFSSGMFMEGAPEMVLLTTAKAEMAQYYGLPSICAGCLTDAKEPGPQAVLEKLLTTMPLVFSGADVVQGIGLVETSQLLVLEQIVIDNEIAGLCNRLRQGIDCRAEKNLSADIDQVGPGGHFLKAKSTRKAMRTNEFFRPGLVDRRPHDEWVRLGRPDMYATARQEVEKIMAEPFAGILPAEIVVKMGALLKQAQAIESQ